MSVMLGEGKVIGTQNQELSFEYFHFEVRVNLLIGNAGQTIVEYLSGSQKGSQVRDVI